MRDVCFRIIECNVIKCVLDDAKNMKKEDPSQHLLYSSYSSILVTYAGRKHLIHN